MGFSYFLFYFSIFLPSKFKLILIHTLKYFFIGSIALSMTDTMGDFFIYFCKCINFLSKHFVYKYFCKHYFTYNLNLGKSGHCTFPIFPVSASLILININCIQLVYCVIFHNSLALSNFNYAK